METFNGSVIRCTSILLTGISVYCMTTGRLTGSKVNPPYSPIRAARTGCVRTYLALNMAARQIVPIGTFSPCVHRTHCQHGRHQTAVQPKDNMSRFCIHRFSTTICHPRSGS